MYITDPDFSCGWAEVVQVQEVVQEVVQDVLVGLKKIQHMVGFGSVMGGVRPLRLLHLLEHRCAKSWKKRMKYHNFEEKIAKNRTTNFTNNIMQFWHKCQNCSASSTVHIAMCNGSVIVLN